MYNVEIYELGYWETDKVFADLVTACHYASRLVRRRMREENIRILDPENRPL